MKVKVRHLANYKNRPFGRKVKVRRLYDLGDGVYPSQKEMEFYFMVLGNIELCRLIKLNLPRTAKMQKYLDKVKK